MKEPVLLKNIDTIKADIGSLKTGKLDASNHSWNSLLNKPSSLPANGGNADTVDGLHSHQLGTLASSGASHGTSFPLYCKHNVHGDNRFKLMLDTHETRVDYATNADYASTSNYANSAANANYASSSNIANSATNAVYGVSDTDYANRKLRCTFMSTGNPAGGYNGDIWIKYN